MSTVQIIPLGGAGEIGKNCTAVVMGDDMILVDAGLSFPNEEMFGVDIVLPDFTYVIENKEKLRGVFLTHAHEDHVGALPYLASKVRCPIYATEFTHAMIRPKLEEKSDIRSLELETVRFGEIIKVGNFEVEFIRMTHSIPDNGSIAIRTPHGIVLFTGDFKLDFTPVDGKLSNLARLAELGREGVITLMSDSTNVERPGWGPSEREVSDGFRKVFTEAPGRVLITTFASNVHRMQTAFTVAAETGRKVAMAGRRMEQVADICTKLGHLVVERGVRVPLADIGSYPPNELVILTTGSQGEPMSALVQMSKESYSRMQIHEGDTLVYSARPIPGNESAIWRTINRLFRMGANVIYDSPTPIHVSGHAYREELKMIINLLRPYYIAPVHGEPRHQALYREMALGMGHPDERIFLLADGEPLCFDDTSAWVGDSVPCGRVLVDNGGNPGVSDEVLRDRSGLANDGVVAITVAIDVERGELVGDPIVQARGFSGPESVLEGVGGVVQDSLDAFSGNELKDVDLVRHTVNDSARKWLHKRAQLRPLVLPMVIEV